MSKWIEVADTMAGDEGMPGSQYAKIDFTLYRRGDRWKVIAEHSYGSNQGVLQSHGGSDFEGRGDSPQEAIDAMRDDVLAGRGDWAAEISSEMRRLVYIAEDAEEGSDA